MHLPKISLVRPDTVDSIDASAYPQLRGFWKCNEGSGSTVIDYSMYSNNLTIELSGDGFNASSVWSNKPGWLSIKNHDRARIAINASLTTGAKFVIVACSMEHENVLSDCDLGTAWNSDGIATGAYRGFSIAPLGDIIAMRVIEYTPGAGNWASNMDLTMTQAVATGQPLRTPLGIAGVFRPATSVSLSINGGALITSNTTTETLGSQDNTFALGSANLNLSSDGYTAIKDYQLWVFDKAPPRLNETLIWLSNNPGKVPWWWESFR
jgi:hypothetical protein